MFCGAYTPQWCCWRSELTIAHRRRKCESCAYCGAGKTPAVSASALILFFSSPRPHTYRKMSGNRHHNSATDQTSCTCAKRFGDPLGSECYWHNWGCFRHSGMYRNAVLYFSETDFTAVRWRSPLNNTTPQNKRTCNLKHLSMYLADTSPPPLPQPTDRPTTGRQTNIHTLSLSLSHPLEHTHTQTLTHTHTHTHTHTVTCIMTYSRFKRSNLWQLLSRKHVNFCVLGAPEAGWSRKF